jgi:hypothetical protein
MSRDRMVGNRRLLKLVDFLKVLPPKQFDYALIWDEPADEEEEEKCGSIGCAMGWCPAIPSFRKAGVTRDSFGDPVYQGERAFHMAAAFFRMSEDDAEDLFSPCENYLSDATPKQVAKKIREWVKDHPSA